MFCSKLTPKKFGRTATLFVRNPAIVSICLRSLAKVNGSRSRLVTDTAMGILVTISVRNMKFVTCSLVILLGMALNSRSATTFLKNKLVCSSFSERSFTAAACCIASPAFCLSSATSIKCLGRAISSSASPAIKTYPQADSQNSLLTLWDQISPRRGWPRSGPRRRHP